MILNSLKYLINRDRVNWCWGIILVFVLSCFWLKQTKVALDKEWN